MASKLQKLQGIPRIAAHDMEWKSFHVRQGYAYGLDDDGNVFVSPCVPTDDGSLFIWIARDDKPVICKRRDEVRGGYSSAIGARSVIMEAGNYATPWALCWQESSLPIGSALAQRIIAAKRKAKPCARDPYRGLGRLCPAGI